MSYAGGFSAFLFDMDGTLVDSHSVVERAWGGWLRTHGLDVDRILPTIHGVRIADTVADPDHRRNAGPMRQAALVESVLQPFHPTRAG